MTEHANASDLVKRLRQQSWCGPLHIEAADEIERLTGVAAFQDGCIKACHQEIGRLKAALREVASGTELCPVTIEYVPTREAVIARETLGTDEQHGQEGGK